MYILVGTNLELKKTYKIISYKKRQPFDYRIRILVALINEIMKKLIILTFVIVVFGFQSCVEHEVIPPPKPEVEFECSFSATIDSNDYELVEDIDGFYCDPAQEKILLPNPQPSSVKYLAAIRSGEQADYIQLKIGKLLFSADLSPDPDEEAFENFFLANPNPDYSIDSEDGVQIAFRDNAGNVWMSTPDSEDLLIFDFSSLEYESDEEGDYMKFIASFSCNLYDDIEEPTDTVVVENAIYKGYFKRLAN